MDRRQFLAACSAVAVAGCSSDGDGDSGDERVDTTVRDDSQIHPIDLESGQRVEVEIERGEGVFASAIVAGEGEDLIEQTVESESATLEGTASNTGTYELIVTTDGIVDVTATVHDE